MLLPLMFSHFCINYLYVVEYEGERKTDNVGVGEIEWSLSYISVTMSSW